MAGSSTKPSIFISYAHEDEPETLSGNSVKWLTFVTGYLEPAVTQDMADLWVDNLMRGGDDWDREIKQTLEACDVFILLVSRHSLASKYILKTEIETIKQRQQNKEDVRCYPLLLTTTPKYALDPVRDWNIRPKNLKPFSDYPQSERERHMSDAADEIIEIAAEIARRKARQPPAPPPLPPAAALAAAPEPVLAEPPANASPTLARQPRNLPFATIGPLFVGREPALAALSVALAGKPSAGVALHGLGGVGKTRLAIEYALVHAADYSALIFARADDPTTLNANLASLPGAEVLDLPEKEARDDATKIEAVLRWLETHPTWLLILDNVDDAGAVAAVTKLMPRLTNGHVIVTARATIFPAGLRKLEVDVLDEDSATRFLLDRTREERVEAPNDEALAREIAHEFDGLALGLEQAGAYIATEKIGFARYLTLWKESRDKVVGLSLTGSEKTLATVWATSVARLRPESRRLLDLLAMLAPDPIPNSLLDVAVPGEAEGYDAYAARSGLFAYSLATPAKGKDVKGFVIHRLVQDFARRNMKAYSARKTLREAARWMNAAFGDNGWDVHAWSNLDPLAPHALMLTSRAERLGISDLTTARLLRKLAILSGAKARFSVALKSCKRALELHQTRIGPYRTDVAGDLVILAKLLSETNRLHEAEVHMLRARRLIEMWFGPTDSRVADCLDALADLVKNMNRPGEAERLYRRALAVRETSREPNDSSLAAGLIKLALLLEADNRPKRAEPLCRRALSINEAKYGSDHPKVAINLSILAGLLQDISRFAEAMPLYRRALKIWETLLELDDPQVAIDFNNVSRLFRGKNGLNEPDSEPLFRCAEPLFRRALTICDSGYGSEHPNVAICLNNLAVLIQDLAVVFKVWVRLDTAEPLYLRAEAILGNRLDSHPTTLLVRKNLIALAGARELRDLRSTASNSGEWRVVLSDELQRTSPPEPIIPLLAPIPFSAQLG